MNNKTVMVQLNHIYLSSCRGECANYAFQNWVTSLHMIFIPTSNYNLCEYHWILTKIEHFSFNECFLRWPRSCCYTTLAAANKPFPEPVLTNISNGIWRHYVTLGWYSPTWGPIYYNVKHDLTLIPNGISYHMPNKLWDGITIHFHFNGCIMIS